MNIRENARCFECAWCSPDSTFSPVCVVYARPLSRRDLWRLACDEFEPIETTLPEEPEDTGIAA